MNSSGVQQMGVFCTKQPRLPSFSGFCVYVHRKNSDGQAFYIGLGRRARVKSKTGRNSDWNAVAAQGYTYEVLETFGTATEAAKREIELIAEYREAGAPLVNRSLGGEGVARWITRAPDPLAEYAAIDAKRMLQPKIDAWLQAKMPDYRRWLKRLMNARKAVERDENAERMTIYRASLR